MSLIANPIEDPLFLPLVMRVGGVLVIILAAIIVLGFAKGKAPAEDILIKRWFSWLAIAVVLVLGLLSGGLPFAILVSAMIVQGLREYSTLVGLPALYRKTLLLLGSAIPFCALVSEELFYLVVPLFLVGATIQPLYTFPDNPRALRHLAFAVLGWGYIAWFLAHLVLIHKETPGGPGLLIVVLTAVAMSDVGAYTFGRSLGKTKLAPKISPNKTRAGGVGNIAGAFVAFGIMSFALPAHLPTALLIVLPVVIGVSALWGDLFESVIKREFGVKDAGDWLPGFGGLLDRMDSLIIATPIVFYSISLLA